MKEAILNQDLTSKEEFLTLNSVLKDPELSFIIKRAAISIALSSKNVAKFHDNQRNRY